MLLKLAVVATLVACGGDPKVPPSNTPVASVVALPADAELGVIAIQPPAARNEDSWMPHASFAFLVEGALGEGKGPPPSWIAIGSSKIENTVTVGRTEKIQFGCDNNMMTVTRLANSTNTLSPGLLWLRPPEHAAWSPAPLRIVNEGAVTATRRGYRAGPIALDVVRSKLASGTVNVVWNGKTVYSMPFERGEMAGADHDAPMDLTEGSVGQPIPEAAWSFKTDAAALIVFRVKTFEGIALKPVVVNQETGRLVEPMSLYLYQCAF